MRIFFLAISVAALSVGGASAQEDNPYPPFPPCEDVVGTDLEKLQSQVECLEARIEELRESQILLWTSQTDLRNQLAEAAKEFDFKLNGPPKTVRRFGPVSEARTHGYWAGGAKVRVFNCVDPLSPPAGMTQIGGELGPQVQFNSFNFKQVGASSWRGCAPDPFCDSAGEFCKNQNRSAGCFVNTEWLDWFRQWRSDKGLAPPSQDEICA